MKTPDGPTFIAFDQQRQIASGALADVVVAAKQALDEGSSGPLLILDAHTSRRFEIDLRGTPAQVLTRLGPNQTDTQTTPRAPGRPRLGVVPREVTLLPRHWEWLNGQPGGASASLRRLVEQARRGNDDRARAHQAMESVERFMLALAGDLSDYEEVSRAFYRGDQSRFVELIAEWPADVRGHLQKLAEAAWPAMAGSAAQKT